MKFDSEEKLYYYLCKVAENSKTYEDVVEQFEKDNVSYIDLSNQSILPQFYIGSYRLYQNLRFEFKVMNI